MARQNLDMTGTRHLSEAAGRPTHPISLILLKILP